MKSIAETEQVRNQLAKILQSALFQVSGLHSRLLEYTVESALHGRAGDLKETIIGIEVLGRPDFDPRTDAAVRSAASRLRSRLTEYYAGPGAADPLLIELPRGGYLPYWRPNGSIEPSPPPPARYSLIQLCAAAVLGAAITATTFWLNGPPAHVQAEFHRPVASVTSPPAVSPDGGRIAASLRSADGSIALWILHVPSGTWGKVAGTESASHPVWSPAGTAIAFYAGEKMKEVRLK